MPKLSDIPGTAWIAFLGALLVGIEEAFDTSTGIAAMAVIVLGALIQAIRVLSTAPRVEMENPSPNAVEEMSAQRGYLWTSRHNAFARFLWGG